LALNHNNLENYYTTVFALVQHHKYSITEIDNLIPFERDIFVEMLANYLKELEDARQRMKK
jgi:hypothetical protein